MKFKLNIFLILFCLYLNAHAIPDEATICSNKTTELGNLLLVINSKIRAMPVLAGLYSDLNTVWDKARSARESGNFKECIRINDIGISTARLYAN
jgi:hypothetical protein